MKLKKKQLGLYVEPLLFNDFASVCMANGTTISAELRDSMRRKVEAWKKKSVVRSMMLKSKKTR